MVTKFDDSADVICVDPAAMGEDVEERLSRAVAGRADRVAGRHLQRPAAVADATETTLRTQAEIDAEIARLEREMKGAAANLDFERAATIRDTLKSLRTRELGLTSLQAGR